MPSKIPTIIGSVLDRNFVERRSDGAYKTKESANDFSIKIWQTTKEHKIDEYVDEIINLGVTCGLTFGNQTEKNSFLSNPFKNIGDEKKCAWIGKKIGLLNEKYNNESWRKLCSQYQQNFFGPRSLYFVYRFIKNSNLLSNTLPSAATDAIIERWFDRTFEMDKTDLYTIVYEDTDGTIKEIKTGFKDVEVDEDDNIIASPITRYIGVNSYDNMLCKWFYDTVSKKWVPVPIRLIISVESENGENAVVTWNDSNPPTDE